jgi:hypothetical protein
MPTKREVGVDARLERGDSHLRQPDTISLCKGLVGDIGKRVTPPQRERLAEARCGLRELAAAQRVPASRRQGLEPKRINGVSADREDIATAPTNYCVSPPENPPQSRDLPSQCIGAVGQPVTPQDVAQTVVRNHFATPQRKGDEQARQPGASNREEAPEIIDQL